MNYLGLWPFLQNYRDFFMPHIISKSNKSTNKSIFMAGLPCSGKSTLTRLLGQRLGFKYFCEPEEASWPLCVQDRILSGNFGAAMWFRSIRSHFYYKAINLVTQGETVLVDSYFDKLFYNCLGRPHMEWLINKQDPYFSTTLAVAELDYNLLPLPDILVFFELEFEEWMSLIKTRNRELEKGWFNENFFQMQTYIREAVNDLEGKHNCKVIRFKPIEGNLEFSLQTLIEQLSLNFNGTTNELP